MFLKLTLDVKTNILAPALMVVWGNTFPSFFPPVSPAPEDTRSFLCPSACVILFM